MPALEALGRVLWRGVRVTIARVCAWGGGLRVEGSSSIAGILGEGVDGMFFGRVRYVLGVCGKGKERFKAPLR